MPTVDQVVETNRTPAASRNLKNVVDLCMLITDNAVSCTEASGLCAHWTRGICDSGLCRAVGIFAVPENLSGQSPEQGYLALVLVEPLHVTDYRLAVSALTIQVAYRKHCSDRPNHLDEAPVGNLSAKRESTRTKIPSA